MADFGLTITGFNLKRLEDIKSELEDSYKEVFGNDVDLSPQSPLGTEIAQWSNILSILWEQLLDLYNAFDPDSAIGIALDRLIKLNGLTRKAATFTTVTATLTGTSGTVIPSGALASENISNNLFQNITDVVIPLSGTIDTQFIAQIIGEIPVAAGTLVTIETPQTGWISINNAADGSLGRETERDGELRFRRDQSAAFPASNIIDALYAQLFNINGVNDAVIYNNPNDETDTNGVLAHRFLPIVDGGDVSEIGTAIYINHTTGDKSQGNETAIIFNSRGFEVLVRFDRPVDVDVYVDIETKATFNFPPDGIDQIKQAIVDYGRGELANSNCDNGFKISEDVLYSRLFTPVNSICGHDVQQMLIGTAPAPAGMANIPIAFNEISRWDISRINVTLV